MPTFSYIFVGQQWDIIKSLLLFLLAGCCEIGDGYLVWLWLKEGKPTWLGILGGLILAIYGFVATC
jgi:small multidrug resistance family-3 protein